MNPVRRELLNGLLVLVVASLLSVAFWIDASQRTFCCFQQSHQMRARATLGWSRATYVEFVTDERMETVLGCWMPKPRSPLCYARDGDSTFHYDSLLEQRGFEPPVSGEGFLLEKGRECWRYYLCVANC